MKNSLKAALLAVLLIVALFGLLPYLGLPDGKEVLKAHLPSIKLDNQAEAKEITILFGGDFMFDRYIREVSQKKGNDYILEKIKPTLMSADAVIVNLESPITDYPSKSIYSTPGSPENYIFTADPSVAKTLADHNVKVVTLGNNHILNFGVRGLEQTEKYLKDSGINYFGTDKKPYELLDFESYRVGFIGYNQFAQNSESAVLKAIVQIQNETDLIIIYAHWGEEYITQAGTDIQNIAHGFIDRGADVIIGSHPHVVQQSEVYNGKTIYYSLGNFVMDQYFQTNVKQGLLVKLKIKPSENTYSVEEIPIETDLTAQPRLSK